MLLKQSRYKCYILSHRTLECSLNHIPPAFSCPGGSAEHKIFSNFEGNLSIPFAWFRGGRVFSNGNKGTPFYSLIPPADWGILSGVSPSKENIFHWLIPLCFPFTGFRWERVSQAGNKEIYSFILTSFVELREPRRLLFSSREKNISFSVILLCLLCSSRILQQLNYSLFIDVGKRGKATSVRFSRFPL